MRNTSLVLTICLALSLAFSLQVTGAGGVASAREGNSGRQLAIATPALRSAETTGSELPKTSVSSACPGAEAIIRQTVAPTMAALAAMVAVNNRQLLNVIYWLKLCWQNSGEPPLLDYPVVAGGQCLPGL